MEAYNNYNNGSLLREQYRKLADLSKGSYGLVSVAQDTFHSNRLVAVKYIYPLEKKKKKKKDAPADGDNDDINESESDGEENIYPLTISPPSKSILQSLYDEAKKEITIHKILGPHPNIAALYDHFDSCLILEYCSRGDLYDAIQDGKGPSTSQDIKDVFYQILDALEFCHSKNVFHRDLKPENILISEDWSIKLCDWGLATTSRLITNKNEFDVGSERYMAPELFDPAVNKYDASKIDLWSIGIILLTLVFHKNPFQVANHSDKRFLQFVMNREALFDIFSTMSGEMFSVLRYCLNIDPTNRDIEMLKKELVTLKYFTIDEEYWEAEHDEDPIRADEDEEDEGNDEDDEDGGEDDDQDRDSDPLEFAFDVDTETRSDAPTPNELVPQTDNISGDRGRPLIRNRNLESAFLGIDSALDSETLDSAAESASDAALPIPHNHRADALLSKNSSMLPIPILTTAYNDGPVSIFRNPRKPFGVASFNQARSQYDSFGFGSAGGSGSNKFNREDFFTPKSVFTHYMDKYGDSRQLKNNNGHYGNNNNNVGGNYRSRTSTWKKKGKRRSWKKATIDSDNYDGNKVPDSRSRSRSRIRHSFSSSHNGGNRDYHKKKAHSFSSSKPRKLLATSNLSGSASSSQSQNQNGNGFHHHSSSIQHQLQHHPQLQNSSNTKKYVPPYLRSPQHARSPLIEPPIEDIANLNLDDEVFQLDFEESGYSSGGGHHNSHHHGHDEANGHSHTSVQSHNGNGNGHLNNHNHEQSHSESNYLVPSSDNNNGQFKKPPINFKVPTYSLAPSVNVISASPIVELSNVRATGGRVRRNSMGQRSVCPTSSNGKPISSISELPSSNGKYVPPFRRGSQPSNITSKIKDSPNQVQSDANECNDNRNKFAHKEFKRDIMTNLDATSSSVPTGKSNWFADKKDWGDYDDDEVY